MKSGINKMHGQTKIIVGYFCFLFGLFNTSFMNMHLITFLFVISFDTKQKTWFWSHTNSVIKGLLFMYGFQVKCRGRDLQENFQNMTLKNKSCQIIHVLFTNSTNGVIVYSKLNLSIFLLLVFVRCFILEFKNIESRIYP